MSDLTLRHEWLMLTASYMGGMPCSKSLSRSLGEWFLSGLTLVLEGLIITATSLEGC